MNGKCISCGETVRIKSTARKGDLIYCQKCDAELEIINLSPVEFDWPLYDYDEDDFEYEYKGEEDDDVYEYDYDDDDN